MQFEKLPFKFDGLATSLIMEEDPFTHLNEKMLRKILCKHHIRTTLEVLKNDYFHYIPEYCPAIIDDVPDVLFNTETHKVFNFKKSWTTKSRKDEFKARLKKYWEYFCCESFEELINIIYNLISNFNQDNPKVPRPCIISIPLYGGLLVEPSRFPDEKELSFIKQAEIALAFTYSQEEQKEKEADNEDMFINPGHP
jgi:hypothetical protein